MSASRTSATDVAAGRERTASPGQWATVLEPEHEFPASLAELELPALQVLHSRICRQLEREYLDPAGPQPVTLDRQQELAEELTVREGGPG